eukprot:TRINITY_DN25845_c0_g1_i1.p1 TRINITY_DN25845_c0_g1~~TRINITY_DN25845_c0_g1_i1.p1  ORF type:complete len:105 (-),score=12.83 TRINITY_DN25845_c0_g1_i1:53-367(-)
MDQRCAVFSDMKWEVNSERYAIVTTDRKTYTFKLTTLEFKNWHKLLNQLPEQSSSTIHERSDIRVVTGDLSQSLPPSLAEQLCIFCVSCLADHTGTGLTDQKNL